MMMMIVTKALEYIPVSGFIKKYTFIGYLLSARHYHNVNVKLLMAH